MNYAIFKKPSRYIGNEINISRKDGDVRVALCFPDTYEIGMSHLGLRILYSIINSVPYASAERVYAPWMDLEAYLRQNSLPLESLEHRRPLRGFDMVGFTLQYELSYTNVLNMLDLGGLPVRSGDRGDEYPVVIAGGPCAVNPLPLAPFMDAFVIGDGEEVIKDILDIIYKGRSQKPEAGSKQNILNALAGLEGVYVPSIHDKEKKKIRRRTVEDLDAAAFPDAPLLPYNAIVHDRVTIEVSRGCTRGCRFCQAGMIYRPLRERSVDNVLSLAGRSLAATGYEDVSFTSLSTGDYSGLLPLIRSFNKMCRGAHVSVSLPSLRVGAINSEVLKEIKSVRKTGFTIAPEAGTKRLRNVINKDYTDEEYEGTLDKLFKEGWTTLKLYFMIGLPSETMADIDGIIDMTMKAFKKGRLLTGRRVNINLGVSVFVPKPHTPFQWTGQDLFNELRGKQDYIRNAFRNKNGISFKGQHVENSLLEAVFSRGGLESALLLEEAWKLGCRFDGWSEHFDFDKWMLASEKAGIDLYSYASRDFSVDEELPWDLIDTGITKEYLVSEHRKALREEMTADCRDACHACGLECRVRAKERKPEEQKAGAIKRETFNINVPCRLRVRFSKTGAMRCLSHHELMTAIIRAVRRADIPVAYSSGFHPHPKVSFGPPLATGVEGMSEFFDIELSALIKPDVFMGMLNPGLPEGLEVHEAEMVTGKAKSLSDLFSFYKYEIEIAPAMEEHINTFMNKNSCPVAREERSVDIRPMVAEAEVKDGILRLVVSDTEAAKARLHEILKEMLQAGAEEVQALMIKRTGLYGYNSKEQINTLRG
ncbi:MAG: TIGR03960 family B12-binding radical SAM protein [Nitrospirota bacterium]|nr:TIGR03960 family B12-binding radical SAM protein [Nitrospirota bacterium]